MKIVYTCLLFIVAINISCSKNSTEPQAPHKHKQPVTFSTNGFQQTVSVLSSLKSPNISSNDTLIKYAPKLYCQIYKLDDEAATDGFLVFNSTYKPSDNSFGTINTILEPGSYVAIFVASGHPFYRIAGLGGEWPDMRYIDSHFNTMTSVALPFIPVDQIFYKKVAFVIGNQPVNQQVTMTRMVAGLDVVIKDAVPSNVTTISVVVEDAPIYNFYQDNSAGNVDKISGITPQYTGSNIISTYVLASGTRGVQIIAYAGEQIVAQKNVTCTFYTNKKTRLEGSLFTTTASFTLSVDPVWEAPPPVITF